MRQSQKQKNSNTMSKGFMIVFIALALVIVGIIVYSLWYVSGDASMKLGNYKGLTINANLKEISEDKLLEMTDEEELVKQAVLNKVVGECSFSHLTKDVDERYQGFMNYYAQLAVIYSYESVEDLAIKYYGYESYEKFSRAVMKYSETCIKQEMVLAEIAKKEGFSVTDEIFDKYIVNYLKAYGYQENEADAYLEAYGKEEVYEVILADYTLDYLMSVNTVNKN